MKSRLKKVGSGVGNFPLASHYGAKPCVTRASRLEANFWLVWKCAGGSDLEREFRFCDRKWRADFAHLPSRTLIEIEGGIWSGGRHSRGSGFEQDCEKYLEAALLGWRVLRLTGKQLELGTVERIVAMVKRLEATGLVSWDCVMPVE